MFFIVFVLLIIIFRFSYYQNYDETKRCNHLETAAMISSLVSTKDKERLFSIPSHNFEVIYQNRLKLGSGITLIHCLL